MSSVRFRLDNEQLPQPTAPSPCFEPYSYSEKESKCTSSSQIRRITSPHYQTCAEKFGQTPVIFGPGHQPFFQSVGQAPSHTVPTVLEYSSPGERQIPVQTMDSTILQYSPTRVHKTADYKSIHKEFSNGGMERPSVDLVDRLRSFSPQHGPVGRHVPPGPLLSDPPDTDLCLSMVNETRPSYQMKTQGKQPLTPGHLTSLFNNENQTQQNSFIRSSNFNRPASPVNANLSPKAANKPAYLKALENSSYSQSLGVSSLAPPPLPPPPFTGTQASFNQPRLNSPVNASTTSTTHASSSTYSASSPGGKTLRTFEDFDLDDILKDLQKPFSSTGPIGFHRSPVHSPINRPLTVPIQYGQSQKDTTSHLHSVVSPKARGLAPPPTDQPVRSPAMYGVEANVDAMTIRMMRNMETGYGAAGNSNCSKCGEGIFSERPGCVALNKTFHISCFTCDTCQCKLSGSPFYAVEDKHFCETDYIQTLDKCATCGKHIRDRILRASGKAYHPPCFVCASCFRELDGIPFTVDSNSVNYCMQCFHEKFAPRCAACHKPIAPQEGQKETTRVVALDRSYHLQCYICEDCKMQLSSAIEGHGCYPLDNHLLCKNCNTNRLKKLTAPS